MLSTLFALLLALAASWGPSPVGAPGTGQLVVVEPLPHKVGQPAQDAGEVPTGPVVDGHDVSVPEPAPVVDVEPAPVELGPGEYAPQLPEETQGRAY
jgi:hypothetical protein